MQVSVLPIGEAHLAFAADVVTRLKEAGIRIDIADDNETLGKKIRSWKLAKIPYALVIGDKETASNTVTRESRDRGTEGQVSLDDLIPRLVQEISEKK